MTYQGRLILFFFITSFGTALSGVGAFLSLESTFNNLIFLGLALSLKTFGAAILSFFSNRIISRIGLFPSLKLTQLFGCLALLVLYLGFKNTNIELTLFGMVLTGFPGALSSILMTTLLRLSSDNEVLFRKFSGRRELVCGIAFFMASLLSPILLYFYNLNLILGIDLVTYLVGFLLIKNIQPIQQSEVFKQVRDRSLFKIILKSTDAKKYILKINGSLLLVGLLPLLAASKSISLTADFPILFRQWLWLIEDVTAVISSLLYVTFLYLIKKKYIDELLMINSVWLFFPIFFGENRILVVIFLFLICLILELSGQIYRDNLIIGANNDTNLIASYSAISVFQKNFVYCISPLILSVVFSIKNTPISVLALFMIQITFWVFQKFISSEQPI